MYVWNFWYKAMGMKKAEELLKFVKENEETYLELSIERRIILKERYKYLKNKEK